MREPLPTSASSCAAGSTSHPSCTTVARSQLDGPLLDARPRARVSPLRDGALCSPAMVGAVVAGSTLAPVVRKHIEGTGCTYDLRTHCG